MRTVEELIRIAQRAGASDVHLAVGVPPKYRISGELKNMSEEDPVLKREHCEEYAVALIGEEAYEGIRTMGELDTAKTICGVRCRLNLYRQQGNVSIAIRLLKNRIPPMKTLGLPEIVETFSAMKRGLVIISGDTGSGKSTTIAALIDKISKERPVHIITLEDPIEYVYSSDIALINQREIGMDTKNFASGVRSILREDPDVIMIGEMRDMETISCAIRAAETGHLVLATLHARSAADAVDRMVDIYPDTQQAQIRLQLAACLNAVVEQQLLEGMDTKYVLASEVMMMTPAIRTLVREGKTHQIDNAIRMGAREGCTSMDSCLIFLCKSGKISKVTCISAAYDQEYVKKTVLGGIQ